MQKRVSQAEFNSAIELALKGVETEDSASGSLSILHFVRGKLCLTVSEDGEFRSVELPLPEGNLEGVREILDWHGVPLADLPNLKADFHTEGGRTVKVEIGPYIALAAKAARLEDVFGVFLNNDRHLEFSDCISAVLGEKGEAKVGELKMYNWLCRTFNDPAKPHLNSLSEYVEKEWVSAEESRVGTLTW